MFLRHVRSFCFCFYLQNVELPDSFSKELKSLLEGLLQRDVDKRLGCRGNGQVIYYVTNFLTIFFCFP